MYKKSGFMEKFEFVEYMISWKFNEKLRTLDVQKIQIWGIIRIHGMYNIVKIQWKIEYIRCTESIDLRRNRNSLNVGYHENWLENFVHWIESLKSEKFEFGEYMISWKFNRKLSTIDVQKDRIHEEKKVKFIEWTKLSKFKGKLGALDG